jgi:hypothetical protein
VKSCLKKQQQKKNTINHTAADLDHRELHFILAAQFSFKPKLLLKSKAYFKNDDNKSGTVVHTCSPNTQETEIRNIIVTQPELTKSE